MFSKTFINKDIKFKNMTIYFYKNSNAVIASLNLCDSQILNCFHFYSIELVNFIHKIYLINMFLGEKLLNVSPQFSH